MGNANYHARIRFEDGSQSWLMRVPRVTSCTIGFPEELAAYLIRSEYATLKILETTAVPVPRVFAYGVRGKGTDHGVGVSFLLMEELPGKPWQGDGPSGGPATPEEKTKVLRAYSAIQAELSRHPFPAAGSLDIEKSGNIEVSPAASDRFVVLSPEGPFDTAADYYTAFAEQHLALIADEQLYTEYPVDAYLVHSFMKDKAASLASSATDCFFIKHVDDKGDHVLVDDDLNITGIIDWQMARVVPAVEAFGPSLVTSDMSALCGGDVGLTEDDKALAEALADQVPELAQYATNEQVRRFVWGLAHEKEWEYALPLAKALLQVFGVEQGWDEWRVTALQKYASDERLQILVESEEAVTK